MEIRISLHAVESVTGDGRLYFVYVVSEHYDYLTGDVIGVFEEHEDALELVQNKVGAKTNVDWFNICLWSVGGREPISSEIYDKTGKIV